MDEKEKPRVQAEDNSIAIGEINISGTVTGNISIGHTIIQAADAQLRHDLGILLKNVQTTWIKGVLERSVHQAALLDLGMEIREEAVDNPWRMVIEAPDKTREILPHGKKIKDIFYEANGLLLILGEPGSGKTTTLLQLARDLIAEVDPTFTQPVPVILNLSTWINKEQPLNEWLGAELNSKYRLPKKNGQKWLEERRILPLLDGLDEVRIENRTACVEEINQFVKDYGLQAVVCSRIQDYTVLDVRLGFYRAVYLQPLKPEQVDDYLNYAGDKLTSLHDTLQMDEALKSMAQSPLILNIMSLAYQNTSAEALSDPALNSNEARRRHLFDTYVARMFKRKAGERLYDDEQTKQWLSWLARNLQNHNQEMFLIESLEPSWLQTRLWDALYFLVSRFVSGLMIGPIISLTNGPDSIAKWVIVSCSAGLSVGLIDFLRFEWLHKRRQTRKSPTFQWAVVYVVIMCLISGLIFWLLSPELTPPAALSLGLLFGLLFGLRGSRQSLENDIETVEALRWSWHKAATGGQAGVIVGLSIWLFFALVFDWRIFGPLFEGYFFGVNRILIEGLFSGLVFGLIGAILNGLHPKIIETKSAPNQGIRLSIRNGIFIGLFVGLFAWLLSGRLSLGLGYWLLVALWYGGFDVIQHYVLRLMFVLQGYTPRRYDRFLDYAVDRIFLQKVGGGYRFIHRLLLEHFAEMRESTKKA